MILSDRSIREEISSGRIVIDPLDESCIQPSSVDLHIDRYFRVFRNHTMGYIDVKQDMEELTELVEIKDDDVFILHPGEFVLGSTSERVALPDDLVARLEGKSSLGRLGLLIHSSLPASERVAVFDEHGLRLVPVGDVVRKELPARVVSFDPDTLEVGFHPITGWYEGPADRIFEVALASGRSVRVTAGHALFTLDRDRGLMKVRTGELRPGTRVAIPRVIPEPPATTPRLDLLALAPESARPRLMVEGPTVDRLFETATQDVGGLLKDGGWSHVGYYRDRRRLPLSVTLQLAGGALDPDDRLAVKGSARTLPTGFSLDAEWAWVFGMYVAEGCHRRGRITISTTDQAILDRLERFFAGLRLPVYRAPSAVTCGSTLLAELFDWLDMGDHAAEKRLPAGLLGWPTDLLEHFLEGFVDGNGSREATRASLWSSSADLVDDLLYLCERLGRRASASFRRRNGHGLYEITVPHREHKLLPAIPLPDPSLAKLDRVIDGDLLWDTVVEVRDTGVVEPIYDLEVRPSGRHIENFLAGTGGVFVSNTAGFVDAGWDGHLTLELSNVANLPITLYPGMKIGQISFLRMTTAAEQPYGSKGVGSKYQGQRGPTPSRYFENFRDT